MISLDQHLQSSANTDLQKIFQGIHDAALGVVKEVSRAGLGADVYGAQGTDNVQGEAQQKLDVYADELFISAFRSCGAVAGMASEELDDFVSFDENKNARYVLLIDPLDGSSNIDVNVAIGTIFAVYERVTPVGTPVQLNDFLQPGNKIVAAGYVQYSVSTQLVMSTGKGTHIFTLDPSNGEFMLVQENVRIPQDGKVYAINEVNFDDFDAGLKGFVQWCRDRRNEKGKRKYTGRYIGSLVADFHRNMLKGGIYVYPATSEAPDGKLRLMYECNPMTFLAVQAGGLGSNGQMNILDIVPVKLHQRTPFYVGSKVMMDEAVKKKV